MIKNLLLTILFPTLIVGMEIKPISETAQYTYKLHQVFTNIAQLLNKPIPDTDEQEAQFINVEQKVIKELQSLMSDELCNQITTEEQTLGSAIALKKFLEHTIINFKRKTKNNDNLNDFEKLLKIKFSKYLLEHLIENIKKKPLSSIEKELILIIAYLLEPLKNNPLEIRQNPELKINSILACLWINLNKHVKADPQAHQIYIHNAIEEVCILIELVNQKLVKKFRKMIDENNRIFHFINLKENSSAKNRLQKLIIILGNLYKKIEKYDLARSLYAKAIEIDTADNNIITLKLSLKQIILLGKQKNFKAFREKTRSLIIEILKQTGQKTIQIEQLDSIYQKLKAVIHQNLGDQPNLFSEAIHTTHDEIKNLTDNDFVHEIAQVAQEDQKLNNFNMLELSNTPVNNNSNKAERFPNSRQSKSTGNRKKRRKARKALAKEHESPRPDIQLQHNLNTIYLAKILLSQEKYSQAIETFNSMEADNVLLQNYINYLKAVTLSRWAHKNYLDTSKKLNYHPLLQESLECLKKVLETQYLQCSEKDVCYKKCISMLKLCAAKSYIPSFTVNCILLLKQYSC